MNRSLSAHYPALPCLVQDNDGNSSIEDKLFSNIVTRQKPKKKGVSNPPEPHCATLEYHGGGM